MSSKNGLPPSGVRAPSAQRKAFGQRAVAAANSCLTPSKSIGAPLSVQCKENENPHTNERASPREPMSPLTENHNDNYVSLPERIVMLSSALEQSNNTVKACHAAIKTSLQKEEKMKKMYRQRMLRQRAQRKKAELYHRVRVLRKEQMCKQVEEQAEEKVMEWQADGEKLRAQLDDYAGAMRDAQARVKDMELQRDDLSARLCAAKKEAVNREDHVHELESKYRRISSVTAGVNNVSMKCKRLREDLDELKYAAMESQCVLQNEFMKAVEVIGQMGGAVAKEQQLSISDKDVAALRECTNEAKARLLQEQALREEAVNRYKKEMLERRRLHNLLQELRGNIRVLCRVRPEDGESVVQIDGEGQLSLTTIQNDKVKENRFEFDSAFGPNTTQQEVFEEISPLMQSVMDGFNVCIFAYGQTGSGKTHTMDGPYDDPGVNRRSLEEILRLSRERCADYNTSIEISMLEIYNEHIVDLLLPSSMPDEKLEIRHEGNGNTHVPGLTRTPITCMEDAENAIAQGKLKRSTAATNINEHSSRSHCIVSIHVTSSSTVHRNIVYGKLHLVDLAGSERVSKSEAIGDRLREANYINKSLSALGDVFMSILNKNSHIPYRNSKLTDILQDSLGGDSKTLMFVNISAVPYNAAETLCSLTFAKRAAKVELGPASKHVRSEETGMCQKRPNTPPNRRKSVGCHC